MHLKYGYLFFLIIVFFLPFQAHTQNERTKHENTIYKTFSFDITYLLQSLNHNGFGLGAKYERYVVDHISMALGIHNTVVKTDIEDLWCMTAGMTVYGNYYPFCPDLRKLYIGLGIGADFLHYFDGGPSRSNANATIISVKNVIGWRYSLSKGLGFDIFEGYTAIFPATSTYGDIHEYIGNGLQAGISLKKILKT